MENAGKEKNRASGSTKKEPKANNSRRIGAKGYGLDQYQQEAMADLWAWQEASLKSNIILGGPLK